MYTIRFSSSRSSDGAAPAPNEWRSWDHPRSMGTSETVASLASFERRGAGTDAERRAALWLSRELRGPRRDSAIETFWCRPNWALAHAWHVALAIVGSLVSVASATAGGAIVLAALGSLACDGLAGLSLGRRLTPERASQNVVSRAAGGGADVRLIITANYDAGRTGLVYRSGPRRAAARLRRLAGQGALTPGWLGWLAIGFAWLLVTALVRSGGNSGTAVSVAQLLPTAALVLALALLLELASADFGPSAGDNSSGVAIAMALARALDAAPPRRLAIDVVLQGAGMIGLTRYLRPRRRELTPANTIVLGFGPAGEGSARWWTSDGSLVALGYLRRLGDLAREAAAPETESGARALPYRGRGVTPAFPARLRGFPAITIGCLNRDDLAPRSHQPDDVAEQLDRSSLDRLLGLALTFVDAIDADLRRADTPESRGAAATGA